MKEIVNERPWFMPYSLLMDIYLLSSALVTPASCRLLSDFSHPRARVFRDGRQQQHQQYVSVTGSFHPVVVNTVEETTTQQTEQQTKEVCEFSESARHVFCEQ